jgi:hypothetical protein
VDLDDVEKRDIANDMLKVLLVPRISHVSPPVILLKFSLRKPI